MTRLKPVPYDVIEGAEGFLLVLACEPLRGPRVSMETIPGRGFEFRDDRGGCLRLGNPHPRLAASSLLPVVVAMIHSGRVHLAAAGDRVRRISRLPIPAEFLWHHGGMSGPADYAARPLACLLDAAGGVTSCVLCAPPVGPPLSACTHGPLSALRGARGWVRVGRGLVVDADSLDGPAPVDGDVTTAVAAAFGEPATGGGQGPAWRSQLAIRA